ncbi:hypothetical protein C8Q77DRAFT_1158219 [Trametes polyzona]|nr:hypothetical protein C8Q77DRAFT_1158219 [Trametes polyzona]
MASFLSKVFPRKKEKETNKRASVSSLLEGKFEAVSPTVSPSAAKFEESAQKLKERGGEKEKDKEKEKDGGFSLFRPKSRALSPPPSDTRKTVPETPHLTLNLPVPKEERSRALGVVFEADPEIRSALPDNVIGERRLNPLETLLLVKACSSAIIANGGLEALGVMHPFWYSASSEVQRKLISLFILSLAPKSPITTLSPSPTSALSSFDTELEYTRSPHDIAAVLRWALRHLRLEGESFGRVDGQWKWYQAFAEAERTASYPPNAFSDALAPQVPPSHLQLLIATLDIVSSLAAHSEHNGISGSKLSKFFGLWLLTTKRSEQGDDWASFYARWERAGRILEHLFLAHIRDEAARKKMPLRLAELVKGYPYHSRSASADSAMSTDVDLLPRPRFSTRQYDALYVRIDTQVPDGKQNKHKQHPLRLISDALKSELELTDAKYQSVWEAVRKSALANDEPEPILTHVDGYPSVSRIFADETIRLLSLIPAESSSTSVSTVPTIRTPRPPRQRSRSPPSHDNARGRTTGNTGNGKAPANGTTTSPTSPTSPGSPKDWMDFSTSGFGDSGLGKDFASTLFDKDVEVTNPPPAVERKTSRKRKASPGRSRGSSFANPEPEPSTRAAPPTTPPPPKSKSTVVNIVKLDEAFIDFWSDALLDPISADWPNFVVAQLKALSGLEVDGKPINWIVLEQRFVTPPPPPPPVSTESDAALPPPPKRASSPRPSMRSDFSARKSSTLAAAKKRLTFFSSSQTLGGLSSKAEAKATARKKSKPTRIGEMGEILPEDNKTETKESEKKQESEAGPAPKEAAPAPPVSADVPKAVEPPAAGSKEPSASAAPAATSAPVPPIPILPAPASPITDPISPLTPTADDFPPVPVVGGLLASAAAATTLAAVEPLKTEDAQTEDKPVLAVADEPTVPSDAAPSNTDAVAAVDAPQEKTLPPAPEPVVLTGETPGPQTALDTSEPAALAELSTKIDAVVAQAASSPEVDKLPAAEQEQQQTTEVVPEKVFVEEVVPFATPAEAAAAVQEAAAEEAQVEAPAPAVADVPTAVAAEPEANAANGPAVVPDANEPVAPVDAPAPEPETAAAEVEPTPEASAPVEVPAVEEPSQPEPAPAAEEPIAKAEATPPEAAPVVEETHEAAPAPEESSAAIEGTAKEPAVEEPAAASTPAAVEAAAVEPTTEAPAVEPVPAVLAAPEPEAPAAAEPAPAIQDPEPVAEPQAEATNIPEPAHESQTESAPEAEPVPEETKAEEAPAPAIEEVKDVEGAVVEDVAVPTAEEVVVEPIAEEPASVSEPAKTEEIPVVEAPAPEEPIPTAEPEAAPAPAESVHEEPATTHPEEHVTATGEVAAQPEAAPLEESQAEPQPEHEVSAGVPSGEESKVEPEAPVAVEDTKAEEPASATGGASEAATAKEAAPTVEEAAPVEAAESPKAEPAVEVAQPEAEKPGNGAAHAEAVKTEDAPTAATEATVETEKPAAEASSD